LLGIGTDTLGSVRIPAAFCGIVGFKPSHGRLSMAGIAPLYPRFDSVGLLAASLEDIAQVAGLLLGEPPAAPAAAQRLAVLDEGGLEAAQSEVAIRYRHCVARLEVRHDGPIGAAPPLDWAAASRAALWEVAHEFAERSADRAPGYHDLDDIDGDSDLGRLLSHAARRPADQLAAGRTLLATLASTLADCLGRADALLTPTCPQSAPRIDENPANNIAAFTAAANLAGLPAVAWTQRLATGDPVSLQLIGRHGEDLSLLDLALRLRGYFTGAAASAGAPHSMRDASS
jgi:aspartyl-tRNA(Asn)/glutamyl-tRNA(Gln) amidotransferase subunit A